ncbi:MAG: cupredoxin domain-containing protein [Nitrososphaerales archaeon]
MPHSSVRAVSMGVVAVVVILVILVAGVAVYFVSQQGPTTPTFTMTVTTTASNTFSQASTSSGSSKVINIIIPDDGGYPYAQYTPQVITVVIGVNNTVTWTNQDVLVHDILTASGLFHSGDMATGSTYTFTFTQAGTYPYYCSYHPSMGGVIIVLNA